MFCICIISQGGEKDVIQFSDGKNIQLSKLLTVCILMTQKTRSI